jgi:hypothetical protein
MAMRPRYILVKLPVGHDADGEITGEGQEHLDSVIAFIDENTSGEAVAVTAGDVEDALWLFAGE